MSVCAVVGGQFGSEGKGLIVGHIAKDYDAHVRVGAANAGHTLYTEQRDGSDRLSRPYHEKHVMQQVPCAAYANPDADLFIGAGAMITPEILLEEIALNEAWRRERGYKPLHLEIDSRAHVIQPEHIEAEAKSDLASRIGSTSTIAREGIGAAQAARVMRSGFVQAKDAPELAQFKVSEEDQQIELCDTEFSLSCVPRKILLEGTQGFGLSNVLSHSYPFVTSRHTTAAGLLADVGLPRVDRCILVVRTYPIRVAGNSGPFAIGSREIQWEDIGIDPESERTTVTKKIRRVATSSIFQIQNAARVNGATEIALTFADYLEPSIAGQTWTGDSFGHAYPKVQRMIDEIEQMTGVPVTFIGTGPHSVIER